MPHDVKNNLLSVGDEVLVRCKITVLHEGEDYCNAEMETVHGRRPDGMKEHFYALNTGVIEKVTS